MKSDGIKLANFQNIITKSNAPKKKIGAADKYAIHSNTEISSATSNAIKSSVIPSIVFRGNNANSKPIDSDTQVLSDNANYENLIRDIQQLENKAAKSFFKELYSHSPDKCNILFTNTKIKSLIDNNTCIFSEPIQDSNLIL